MTLINQDMTRDEQWEFDGQLSFANELIAAGADPANAMAVAFRESDALDGEISANVDIPRHSIAHHVLRDKVTQRFDAEVRLPGRDLSVAERQRLIVETFLQELSNDAIHKA